MFVHKFNELAVNLSLSAGLRIKWKTFKFYYILL